MRYRFNIGDTVEIVKSGSDWKGVKGEVINCGLVNEVREYLVQTPGDDLVPAGQFWWVEGSLRKA